MIRSLKEILQTCFPAFLLAMRMNKDNQLTVSYSRRITRPNYQDLNPFTFFLDSLTYRVGNPYLLPQFTHNIELSYAFKSKFIFTLNYNNTNDVISQILKQNAVSKITYNTSENIATVHQYWVVDYRTCHVYDRGGTRISLPIFITTIM
jgi:hypothetical protein